MTSASIRVTSARMPSASIGGPLCDKGKGGKASLRRDSRRYGGGGGIGPGDDVTGAGAAVHHRGVDPPAGAVVGGGDQELGSVHLDDLEAMGTADQARPDGLGDGLLGGP